MASQEPPIEIYISNGFVRVHYPSSKNLDPDLDLDLEQKSYLSTSHFIHAAMPPKTTPGRSRQPRSQKASSFDAAVLQPSQSSSALGVGGLKNLSKGILTSFSGSL